MQTWILIRRWLTERAWNKISKAASGWQKRGIVHKLQVKQQCKRLKFKLLKIPACANGAVSMICFL
jgi:hypothetical protein